MRRMIWVCFDEVRLMFGPGLAMVGLGALCGIW